MKITVFGATGNCGGHFLEHAAQRGHALVAVVRQPSFEKAGIDVRVGDVLDAAFVQSALVGADAVMCGLGMRYAHPWATRRSPDDFMQRAVSHIATGMKASGVGRISMISAAGVGDSRSRLNWPMRVMLQISNVGVAYRDLQEAEATLAATDLDWQAVRPTTLTDRPATGAVKRVERYTITATIPREDVAGFMLGELESDDFCHRTPIIAA